MKDVIEQFFEIYSIPLVTFSDALRFMFGSFIAVMLVIAVFRFLGGLLEVLTERLK